MGYGNRGRKTRVQAPLWSDLDEAESSRAGLAVDPAQAAAAQQQVRSWSAEQALETFSTLARAVGVSEDLKTVARQILENAVRTLGADRGILFLGQADTAGLVPLLAMNIEGEELAVIERVSRTILKQGRAGVLFLTPDALRDERLRDVKSVHLNRIHSVLCLPLTNQRGSAGVLYLDARSPSAFPDNAESLLSSFGFLCASALQNAQDFSECAREAKQKRPEPTTRLVGSNEALDTARRQARVAALLDTPILIQGERGSGRELLARAIHDASPRASQPFIACDCSAAPAELLKGFVFGRTGVAATGAYLEEVGLLRLAERGTLYLGEVEKLGVEAGHDLARCLQRGVFKAMGGRREIRADARIILGSSVDLETEVKKRRFSVDLLRFAQNFRIWMPPLRERVADIQELTAHFLSKHVADREGSLGVSLLTPEGLELLKQQRWPRNVEELEHVIRRILKFSRETLIDARQISQALIPPSEEENRTQGPWSGQVLSLIDWEREAMRQALLQTRGNVSLAAQRLGVHRNTLVRKRKEYGI